MSSLISVQGLAGEWGPLDDVVMGGVSQSRFTVRAGAGPDGGPAGVFSGQVSSANSGGFASVSRTLLRQAGAKIWGCAPLGPSEGRCAVPAMAAFFGEMHCAVQLGAEQSRACAEGLTGQVFRPRAGPLLRRHGVYCGAWRGA